MRLNFCTSLLLCLIFNLWCLYNPAIAIKRKKQQAKVISANANMPDTSSSKIKDSTKRRS